jgi:hypothetical protein
LKLLKNAEISCSAVNLQTELSEFMFVLFLLLSLMRNAGGIGYVANHSFVFIGGWPQSGTSLIHQLLSQNQRLVSSMIPLCEELLGAKRCQSWNHEGQWILDGKTRDHIQSGNVCPVGSVDETVKASIISQVRTILFCCFVFFMMLVGKVLGS